MKGKRIGRQTVQFSTPPVIRAAASVVGRKEGEGPLRGRFDSVSQDTYFGEKSWEQAESAMLRQCFARVCSKAALEPEALDYGLSGDLLNQCVGSAYAMRGVGTPYLGLYGACSTMAEAVSLAALARDRPEDCRLVKVSHSGRAVDYTIPKSWIKIVPPRTASEAQKAALARARKAASKPL